MKTKIQLFSFMFAAMLFAGVINPAAARNGQKDIVDTAVEAASFTTLAKALQTAGLIETLKGAGPFTVFAPTDDAFAKLPAGTVDSLLNNPEKLRQILLYHVVPGRLLAKDVIKIKEARTAEGSSMRITTSEAGVKVDNANVIKTDIIASNGVIHVIDSVMIPGM